MSILLVTGEIAYPKVVVIQDEDRRYYTSTTEVVTPGECRYLSQIVWLPPRDQPKAEAFARQALLRKIVEILGTQTR